MSTNSECLFFEPAPDQWYMALEQKMGWDDEEDNYGGDWLAEAHVAGPFPSEQAARDYLDVHFSNPGGSTTSPYNGEPISPRTQSIIDRAVSPRQHRRW